MKKSILDEKCMLFAVRIVKFYQYLCTEKKEYVLSKQILRSGTSIGANLREVGMPSQHQILFINLILLLKRQMKHSIGLNFLNCLILLPRNIMKH